eukprot:Blabericola_migrator_1__1169@NODE_12_length_24658_cov_176_683258_g9_i0_p20_GENE_NODE_12_length_24658_cov_176_683258_g9_i0NODE_12_length_24658_cov_176_683258_g9_i0_p20_ORF_typecomplete_len146_score23_84zfCCCH/PF00642_24/2_2e07zfCCCH_4/PF18044_1/3_3e05zfCCCH_3/PF15663_5/0_0029Torus/PF16131_5/0_0057zf_CCCH_4/PF18345_1/0_048_NODE_12_length_24658_cov_176_683258_g9_i01178812225
MFLLRNDFYKTTLCRYWMKGDCYAGNSCRHAHGTLELRTPVGLSAIRTQRLSEHPSDMVVACEDLESEEPRLSLKGTPLWGPTALSLLDESSPPPPSGGVDLDPDLIASIARALKAFCLNSTSTKSSQPRLPSEPTALFPDGEPF